MLRTFKRIHGSFGTRARLGQGSASGRRWPAWLALLGTLGAFSTCSAITMDAGAHERAPVVHACAGALRGTSSDGVDRFLAIPYAAPPVGDLRWQPPAPPAAWKGIRSADTLPPRCTQFDVSDGSEDCLYLNVYRPAHKKRRDRLPVLFYIHGGALKVGAAIDNDPSRIARLTDTVVVMINYRLGQFGFLAHPALGAEAGDGTSGEYGLMDQQAALQWVRDNIDAFGGDPSNVTIAGGSAGAWSVCAHLTSPNAAGLFSRAVIQSGACTAIPRAQAEAQGLAFATALGCPNAASSECLRQKTTAEVLTADSWAYPSLPVFGGQVLPEAPDAAVSAGRFHHVPILIGGTRDEFRGDLASFYPMSEDVFLSIVNDTFGDAAPVVLAEYPLVEYEDPVYAFADIALDSSLPGVGACATRRLALTFAQFVPTFEYEFYDQSAPLPSWLTIPPDYDLGASHGTDEMYWFDRPFHTVVPLNGIQRQLANGMIEYLGAFVDRGIPRVRHQPSWPRFKPQREFVMRFAPYAVGARTDFDDEHRCAFWSSLGF